MGAFRDLTGRRFGRLVATEYVGRSFWKCKCDCGSDTVVRSSNLLNGGTQSCSHVCSWLNSHRHFIGRKFGRLTLEGYSVIGDRKVVANFVCDCGNRVTVCAGQINDILVRGAVKSCGCLKSENLNAGVKRKNRRKVAEEFYGKHDSSFILISLDGNKDNICIENLMFVDGATYKVLERENMFGRGDMTKTFAMAHTLQRSTSDNDQI